MSSTPSKFSRCPFTGHRIIPLVQQEDVRARLAVAVSFACKLGMTRFYCGMALASSEQERYRQMLAKTDKVVVLSENYFRGCLLKRNDYMLKFRKFKNLLSVIS